MSKASALSYACTSTLIKCPFCFVIHMHYIIIAIFISCALVHTCTTYLAFYNVHNVCFVIYLYCLASMQYPLALWHIHILQQKYNNHSAYFVIYMHFSINAILSVSALSYTCTISLRFCLVIYMYYNINATSRACAPGVCFVMYMYCNIHATRIACALSYTCIIT